MTFQDSVILFHSIFIVFSHLPPFLHFFFLCFLFHCPASVSRRAVWLVGWLGREVFVGDIHDRLDSHDTYWSDWTGRVFSTIRKPVNNIVNIWFRGVNCFRIWRTRFLIFQRGFLLRRKISDSHRDFHRFLRSELPLLHK